MVRAGILAWDDRVELIDSEPQPDLALLRPRPDFYAAIDPTPADALLLVEVPDTTLEADRRVKMLLYARHGILELWLIDLQHDTVTVYRDPTPTGYHTAQLLRRGDQLSLGAFPSLSLAVADVLLS